MLSIPRMCWADEMVAGFALAKTIADHPDGDLATDSLVPAAAQLCTRYLDKMSTMDSDARRSLLASSAATLREPLDGERAQAMPPRARMWLAAEVPRALGKSWLDNAPRSRRSFRPQGSLLEVLRAVTRSRKKGELSRADLELRSLKEAGCLE